MGVLAGLGLPCFAQSMQVDLLWNRLELPSRQVQHSHSTLGAVQDLEAQTASGLGLRFTYALGSLETAGVRLSFGYQVAQGTDGKATETTSFAGTTTTVQRTGLRTEVRTLIFGAALATGGPLCVGIGLDGRFESIRDWTQPWLDPSVPVSADLLRPWLRGYLQYRFASGSFRPVVGVEVALPLVHPSYSTTNAYASEDAATALAPDKQVGFFLGVQF